MEVLNEQILCEKHSLNYDRIDLGSKNDSFLSRLRCEFCSTQAYNYRVYESKVQKLSPSGTMLISLNEHLKLQTTPSDFEASNKNLRMDFSHLQLEYIIFDENPSGYNLRSLLYLPDKKLLVTCRGNEGDITFWNMDQLTIRQTLQLGKEVHCVKYFTLYETQKLLLFAAGNEVKVYDFSTDELVHNQTMQCEDEVADIVLQSAGFLITVGKSALAQLWTLSTFDCVKRFVYKNHNIHEPVFSAVYIPEEKTLALEDSKGICLINTEKEKDPEGKSLAIRNEFEDKVQGCVYMPLLKEFVFRRESAIAVADAKTLALRILYPHPKIDKSSGFEFVFNQNESQVISNSNSGAINFIHMCKNWEIDLFSLIKESGPLCMASDFYRLIVGDQKSGTLLVFRANIPGGVAPTRKVVSMAEVIPTVKPPKPVKVTRLPWWSSLRNPTRVVTVVNNNNNYTPAPQTLSVPQVKHLGKFGNSGQVPRTRQKKVVVKKPGHKDHLESLILDTKRTRAQRVIEDIPVLKKKIKGKSKVREEVKSVSKERSVGRSKSKGKSAPKSKSRERSKPRRTKKDENIVYVMVGSKKIIEASVVDEKRGRDESNVRQGRKKKSDERTRSREKSKSNQRQKATKRKTKSKKWEYFGV